MSDIPFKSLSGGFFKKVSLPVFGQQHKGIAPGGAMDCFSYQTGNALLETDFSSPALEIVFASSFQVLRDCCFTITGARYGSVNLETPDSRNAKTNIEHAVVYLARAGSVLELKEKSKIGFRTYLCFVEFEKSKQSIIGKRRDSFGNQFEWVDPKGKIRVLEGPEFKYLVNKKSMTENYWIITNEFSEMGFRLANHAETPRIEMKNMISEAVVDGTIQLTPKGPIILLKHRQTVGGYPRIYNVISADVDLLGQYSPNQILRFKNVSIKEAQAVARKKAKTLNRLQ